MIATFETQSPEIQDLYTDNFVLKMSRQCGLFFLVDQLLKHKKLQLAKQLLSQSEEIGVLVNPPNTEDAQNFVERMIHKAELTSFDETAQALVKCCDSHSTFETFCSCWKTFTRRFLELRIDALGNS